MTDDLIEKMCIAYRESQDIAWTCPNGAADCDGETAPRPCMLCAFDPGWETTGEDARQQDRQAMRAALAAIQSSGTHRLVPVDLLSEIVAFLYVAAGEGFVAECGDNVLFFAEELSDAVRDDLGLPDHGDIESPEKVAAMLAAAPKVTG